MSSGKHLQVEEELGDDVEGQEGVAGKLVICETDNAEEDGQHGEAHELDRFPANGIDKGNSDPVARNGTSAHNDDVPDRGIVELSFFSRYTSIFGTKLTIWYTLGPDEYPMAAKMTVLFKERP